MACLRSVRILSGALLVAVLCLTACGGSSQETAANSKDYFNDPVKEYPLEGEIISIDRDNNIAKIRHQAIGDWMGAMTMDFPVKDAAELDALKEGEPVRGTVYVQGIEYWVGNLSKAPAGSGTAGAPTDAGKMDGMNHEQMNMDDHEGMH